MFIRLPKTYQEKKHNIEGRWNRPRRNSKRLVSSWDDLWRGQDRSWKSHRKTQYKQEVDKSNFADSFDYSQSMSKRDHFYKEHRLCSSVRLRCNYCWRHNVWSEYDKSNLKKRIQNRHKPYRPLLGWVSACNCCICKEKCNYEYCDEYGAYSYVCPFTRRNHGSR